MDMDFWDTLVAGLSHSDLEWLQICIGRRMASMHPEKIARKTIIRKYD